MRGPSLYIQTTQAINERLGHIGHGNGHLTLNQYITDSGIRDNYLLDRIKSRLHSYRFRNKHKRAAITQKELAYINTQIEAAKNGQLTNISTQETKTAKEKRKKAEAHTFQIGNAYYTTREYCEAQGIQNTYDILKIQWRVNKYILTHTIQETVSELQRLVHNVVKILQSANYNTIDHKDQTYVLTDTYKRYHKKCGEYHGPEEPCNDDEKQLLKQSEWMSNTPYVTINNNQLTQRPGGPISFTKESLSNEETPKPVLDTTGLLITITDHLELLIGKTIKHETFPIEGKIININNEVIEIDFNGKIVEIELSETNGLLIVS